MVTGERPLTPAEQNFIARYHRVGPADAVRKLGRNWIVECGALSHLSLFKTRREAVEAARRWVDALQGWPKKEESTG